MSLSNSLLRTIAVVLVALLVLKYTKTLTAPIVLALTLGVILSPILETASRRNIPQALAAACATICTIGGIAGVVLILAPAVEEALEAIPRAMGAIRDSLSTVLAIGRYIEEVGQEVGAALGTEPGESVGASELPSAMDAILFAPQLAAQALIFLGTLFFFLLGRDDIYSWVATIFAGVDGSSEVQQTIRSADRSVSRYFITITGINAVLGLAVTVGLYLFGVPSPASWGVAAFFLNYLLYLGPGIFAVALLIMGHVQFDGLMSFGPMVMFLAMNFSEGYLLTPSLVGARLAINPLVIFLALATGLWLWGVIGGIVALPLLVWVLAAGRLVTWSESYDETHRTARTAGD